MEKGARPQRDRKRKSYDDIADGDGDAGGLLAVEREALGGGPKPWRWKRTSLLDLRRCSRRA